MKLNKSFKLSDLGKFEKVCVRIDSETALYLSITSDGYLNIEIKDEMMPLSTIESAVSKKFNDIMSNCNSINKEEIIKDCERIFGNKKYDESYDDSECQDITKDTIEKIKLNNCKTVYNSVSQDCIDNWNKMQKYISPELFEKIMLMIKSDKKN